MSETTTEERITKASTFILPMLGYGRNYYDPFMVNCYIGDGERTELEEHIFILMKFSADTKFGWLEKSMETHDNFKEKYDLENGKYIMFVFNVPEKYKKDYSLFKQGPNYSKFSTLLKHETLRLNDLGPDSNAASAFTKGKKLKKYWEDKIGAPLPEGSEVMSGAKLKYEVYRYKGEKNYPNYSCRSETGEWFVRFNPEPDDTYVICKIPGYYRNPDKIAETICKCLENIELDLTI